MMGRPATLPAAPGTIALIQQAETEAAHLGDPQLSTIHLLLAVLAQTHTPLHDTVQSLGDVNVLNHRRVLERIRSQRQKNG